MALSSMTGFARADGVSGPYAWAWELKSVNAQGARTAAARCRPAGTRSKCRCARKAAKALARGTVHANLSVSREGVAPVVRVNEPVLAAVLATMRRIASASTRAPPSIDGILGIKGVIEVIEQDESEDERSAAERGGDRGFRHGARKRWPRCARTRARRSAIS